MPFYFGFRGKSTDAVLSRGKSTDAVSFRFRGKSTDAVSFKCTMTDISCWHIN